jgi:hypothetical protein
MNRRELPTRAILPQEQNAFQPPVGAPSWVTASLIENTIRVWQPYYPNPLTVEDALGIIQSAHQLVGLLAQGMRK